MLYPDLSRLSLLTPTAAGDEDTAVLTRPDDAPDTARDEVLKTDALVTKILENVRDEDGNPDVACAMAERFCEQLAKSNRTVCVGQNGRENQHVWQTLYERVFPNYSPAAFAAMVDEDDPEQWRVVQDHFAMPGLMPDHLPWSGNVHAYTWRQWFRILCKTYRKRLRDERAFVSRQVAKRTDAREKHAALLKRAQADEQRWLDARRNGEWMPPPPPSKLPGQEEQRRQAANRELARRLPEVVNYKRVHGYTADHKKYKDLTFDFLEKLGVVEDNAEYDSGAEEGLDRKARRALKLNEEDDGDP